MNYKRKNNRRRRRRKRLTSSRSGRLLDLAQAIRKEKQIFRSVVK